MESFSLAVIIPAYNEDYVLEKNILNVEAYLKKNFCNYKIIIIDDGSNDTTYSVALNLSKAIDNLRIVRNKANRGKGYSIKKAVFFTNSDYILFSDADLSVPIEEFKKFIEPIKKNKDIIIGSRTHKNSKILKKQNFIRRNMGKAFNLFVRFLLSLSIRDTQCGFKCFKRQAAWDLFQLQSIEGFCFDVEILFVAKRLGYSIKEVPVRWIRGKKTSVSLLKETPKAFFDVCAIKQNSKNILGSKS